MKTKLIEAVTPKGNHGKFMIGQFDADEIGHVSAVMPQYGSLIKQRGWWDPAAYFLMLDIETGEGAVFRHGGFAQADLQKHSVWVCPLFGPTLERLHKMDLSDLAALPDLIELTFEEAPFAMANARGTGRG